MSASGTNTPRYRVVQGHFYPLVLNFEQSLPTTTALLFQEGLINETTLALGEAGNANQPAFERSSALLRNILKKIQIDQKWYDVFLLALHRVNDLTDIANELDAALKKEEESCNVRFISPRLIPNPPQCLLPQPIPLQHVPPARHGRSYSDSDISRSRPKTSAVERDSGVTADIQNSVFGGGDEVLPEEAVSDSEQPLANESSMQNISEQVSPFLPQRAASSLIYSTSSANHMPVMCGSPAAAALIYSHSSSDPASNVLVVCSSPPNGSLEDQNVVAPIEHTSNDIGMLPPASATFANSDNWNRKGGKKLPEIAKQGTSL